MKAGDIMTSAVAFCRPETNLADAAATMWEHNCGALPVVNDHNHVTGMITDRDICIALATRNRLASELTAGEVSTRSAYICNPDENIRGVLATMRDHKVHRVPVVHHDGTLAGIISIDDIIFSAKEKKGSDITYTDVIETQKAIAPRSAARRTEPGVSHRATESEPALAHGNDFDFEE